MKVLVARHSVLYDKGWCNNTTGCTCHISSLKQSNLETTNEWSAVSYFIRMYGAQCFVDCTFIRELWLYEHRRFYCVLYCFLLPVWYEIIYAVKWSLRPRVSGSALMRHVLTLKWQSLLRTVVIMSRAKEEVRWCHYWPAKSHFLPPVNICFF